MASEGRQLCTLVGAGPGDIGLVTLRAKEVVQQADVIVYDYLCNPEILTWASAEAEIVYVGKKGGGHAMRQEEINQFLVAKTREGKHVVRLKGGDPFVFGRGGEEAEALVDAGLTFEVVPGISSVVAVPAYAGIPVTHRDLTSSVTFFTGHEDPEKETSSLNYRALVQGKGTLVMLMGVERLASIVAQLSANGADPNLPVAMIHWGTTGHQKTIIADLSSIVEAAVDFASPAIAVFGEVVRLREKLNWFERRPLFGRKIVVTRARKQAGILSNRLRLLGADVYELPTIRVVPPENLWEFGELVRDAYQYDWLIFTSPNGVDAFFDMYYKLYSDARNIGNVKIAAIGPATAQRIKEFHLSVDLQPKQFVAEAIIKEFQETGSVENLKFLLARAEGAREALPRKLIELGAIVDETIAYRTIPESDNIAGSLERFRAGGADFITFTSSSTVEHFLSLNLPWSKSLKTASIGPITSETMRKHHLMVDVEAEQHDIDGLVQAILRFYKNEL
jgi:uroporphyrinogen III methyltransferase/synthase